VWLAPASGKLREGGRTTSRRTQPDPQRPAGGRTGWPSTSVPRAIRRLGQPRSVDSRVEPGRQRQVPEVVRPGSERGRNRGQRIAGSRASCRTRQYVDEPTTPPRSLVKSRPSSAAPNVSRCCGGGRRAGAGAVRPGLPPSAGSSKPSSWVSPESASLCGTFRVHEPLVVEAVVTLVGAGRLAVTSGSEAAFVLTDGGHQACSSGKDRHRSSWLRPRPARSSLLSKSRSLSPRRGRRA
jgi:hypothetical protein